MPVIMPVMMLVMLSLADTASAGMVMSPPPGAPEVALLICAPDDPCEAERAWLDARPEPVLPLEALFFDERGAPPPAPIERFREHTREARAALEAASPGEALHALNRAEIALARAIESPSNEELFDFYFVRAAVRAGQDRDEARDELFLMAAAVSWNRTGRPPDWGAPWRDAYYDALETLLSQAPAELRLEGAGTFSLDGVELGEGPLVLRALPGPHRLTAVSKDGTRRWREDITLEAGESVALQADLLNRDHPAEVAVALLEAHETRDMEARVGDFLARWSAEHALVRFTFIVLEPDGDGFRASAVRYDPAPRRISDAEVSW